MRRYAGIFLLCASLLTFGQPTLASSPLILPAGFVDELVVGGLLAPRAFVFTPDGRILIAERGKQGSDDINFASIRVFKNGDLLDTRAIELDVCGDSERGFLGIALDPNFTNNGYIYVYYTRQALSGDACAFNTYTNPPNASVGPRNRISRLTMVGDVITPGSEKILIDNIITDVGYHNAGDLHFDSLGYLYATAGDGGLSDSYPTTTQDTDRLNGKMMRIKPDNADLRGYVTTGNPYENASGARTCGTTAPAADPAPTTVNSAPCREVFASGLRNPFRFTIQNSTNIPFVGDVGGGAWEEVDKILPGGNYGYPNREGPCSAGNICTPPFPTGPNEPIYAYAHVAVGANSDSAIIGGDFYEGTGNAGDYPAQYVGNYFFADFVRGFIRRLVYNTGTDSWSAAVPEFATGGYGLIGLKTGLLDANLYYVAFLDDEQVAPPVLHISEIRRIRYASGENQKPNAIASVNKFNGPVPGTVYTFSAAGSSDPDRNTPLQYEWNFGDGSIVTTSSLTITHAYTTAVNRTVTLRVRDKLGAYSNPVTLTVYPGNIPATGTLVLNNQTAPNRPTTYYAADTWAFNVTDATDPDAAAAPTVSWSIVFHHSTHTHPFVPLATTPATFQIPYQNFEPATNVWFRVVLLLTDARGQVSTVQRDIKPITATYTIVTNPPGGIITQDGANFSTPHVFSRVVGMHTVVDIPGNLTVGSATYPFVRWSDSGAQSHTIILPSANTTFTAFYSPTTPPVRTYFQSEPVILSWSALDWSTGYEVQIDDESGFVQPLHTSALLPVGTLTYTAPTLADGMYYWRVRAKKVDGTFGSYSPAEAFTLLVEP